MVSAVLALLFWQVAVQVLIHTSLYICTEVSCMQESERVISRSHLIIQRFSRYPLQLVCLDDSVPAVQARSLAESTAPVTFVEDKDGFAAALARGDQNIVVTDHLDLAASSVSVGPGTSSISVCTPTHLTHDVCRGLRCILFRADFSLRYIWVNAVALQGLLLRALSINSALSNYGRHLGHTTDLCPL